MKFSMMKIEDVTLIELQGEVWGGWDAVGLKDAVVRMLQAGERKFVVDLKSTGSINSAGIGVLLATQESVRGAGGLMSLCEVNERSRRAFAITDVWSEFESHPTREDALKALGVQP
jgi:anti-anti-sigma factor